MDHIALAAGVLLWCGSAQAPALLVLRNAKHATWGFAKGHLEDGEDLLAGALRECEEETGLRLRRADLVPGFADVSDYLTPRGHRKRVVMFLAAFPCEVAQIRCSQEHDAYEWWAADTAIERLPFAELHRCVVRACESLRQRDAPNEVTQ